MPTYKNARECLSAIVERYKDLNSYVDEGFIRPAGTNAPKNVWFDTHFARPDLFRFQFTRPHPYAPLRHIVTKTVVGSDGNMPYFSTENYRSAPQTEREQSLGLAVAGATGISLGAAHTIGKLLLECVGGFSLSMLKRPRFRRSREFAGQHCSRITGMHPGAGRVTVWFGTSDLLIRKIVRHWAKREEVRYNIHTDLRIDATKFDPPHAYSPPR